jgi:hypothetical protein
MTLPALRYFYLYAFQACASVFWASLAAQFATRFVPAAKIPTFIVVAVLGISLDTFRLCSQLSSRRKPTGFALFCLLLALFSVIYAVILIIGGTIEHYLGGGWGYIFDWYGFVIGGMYVLAYTSFISHQFRLEEDEENPRPVDPQEDARKRREYMHPYI